MSASTVLPGAVLLAGAFASPAAAATLCVNPAGAGGCQATIQAAVELAAPGDTILVGKGLYYENVVVGPGKDGLQVVGAGARDAILDGSPFADRGIPGGEITILVESPNVSIRGLGLRNGLRGVQVAGEGVVLQGLEFRGTDYPILVFAANARLLGNAFYDSVALNVAGAGLLARGNRIERALASFVFEDLAGPGAQIVGNRLEGVRDGLVVHSNIDTVLRQNVLRSSGEVSVTGPNPVVEGNSLFQGSGLFVFCSGINLEAGPSDDIPADCTRASVSGNRVADASSYGMIVGGSQPGTTVARGNVVRRALWGIAVGGSGVADVPSPILVEGNHVLKAGFTTTAPFFPPGACFDVIAGGLPGAADASVTVRRNVASDCGGPGFFVRARGALFEANRVLGAAGSGFYVNGLQSDGLTPTELIELRGNTALRNTAQGIAIGPGAFGTAVTDNVSLGNRVDFCDEGTSTALSGNTFSTTSATCGIGQ